MQEDDVGGRNWYKAKADKVRFKEASEYIPRDWRPTKVGSVSIDGKSTERASVNPGTLKRVNDNGSVVARAAKLPNIRIQPSSKPRLVSTDRPSPSSSSVQIPVFPARHKRLDDLVSDLAVAIRKRNMLLVKSISAEIYLLASL